MTVTDRGPIETPQGRAELVFLLPGFKPRDEWRRDMTARMGA